MSKKGNTVTRHTNYLLKCERKLMMVVDYGGSIFPSIAHAPWHGLHLADFVMPYFLFIAGLSLAIAYKKVGDRMDATKKATLRAVKLFILGVFLQVLLEASSNACQEEFEEMLKEDPALDSSRKLGRHLNQKQNMEEYQLRRKIQNLP